MQQEKRRFRGTSASNTAQQIRLVYAHSNHSKRACVPFDRLRFKVFLFFRVLGAGGAGEGDGPGCRGASNKALPSTSMSCKTPQAAGTALTYALLNPISASKILANPGPIRPKKTVKDSSAASQNKDLNEAPLPRLRRNSVTVLTITLVCSCSMHTVSMDSSPHSVMS